MSTKPRPSAYLRRRQMRLALEDARRAEAQQLLQLGAAIQQAVLQQQQSYVLDQAAADALALGQLYRH